MAVNLSEPFIRRPIMTSLVMAGILLFGILAYKALPISDLPEIAYPVITVTAQNPGMNAETMATTITTILEKQLMSVQGLQSIVSTSSSGLSEIVLQFDLNRGIYEAATDVSQALTQAQGNLPPSMPTPPTYQKTNPADTPVVYVAVSSNSMTTEELYDYGYTAVSQRFSMIEGVSQVQVYGSPRATRVQLNPEAMSAMGIGIDKVANAVMAATQLLPAGTLYDSKYSYTLNPLGQLITGDEYNPIIVEERDGAPVRIQDIGRGISSSQYKDYYINYWSSEKGNIPSVVVAVTKQSGYNTVKICDTITKMLPEMEKQLPPAIKLSMIHDNSIEIKASINDVKFTLFIAFILVVAVIFLFLGRMRTTVIPCLALPMAVIGTFAIMFVNGYSIDILSMLALTLVIGFLVDDAIVVLENIVRHQEMGKTAYQAALDGSAQISTTVLSMTLSLSSVFIPLVFMPGIIGRMFHEFAMVVVIAVLFSGFISLTLTPMLCSRFLGELKEPGRLERFAKNLMQKLLNIYKPMLEWVLRFRLIPILTATASLVCALYFFTIVPQDFLPAGDTGAIQGLTEASESVSYEAMTAYQQEANKIVQETPGIKSIISAANIWSITPPNQGILYFNLKPINERKPINEMTNELREKLATIPGLKVFLKPIPQINLNIGTGIQRAPYQFAMSTLGSVQELYAQATALTEEMKKLGMFVDVSNDIQNDTPQLNIKILRDQASTYGITAKAIEEAINYGYAGGRVAVYNTPINLYWIIMEMEDKFRLNANALDKIYLSSSTQSSLVPLNTVVEWEETTGPMQVNHVNQFTSATIYFDLKDGAALSTAVSKINEAANKILNPQVMRTFQGTAQVFEQTAKSTLPLLIICILVIYLLLGSLYESYLHPLTVLSTLPGALFGGLLMLVIFQSSLSLYSYVGIIVLIGIVLKNGIMLIEFANELVENGTSAHDAIVKACHERFRPILMTTMAAAMGAVPIAVGVGASGSSMQPLGLVILGGLFFAQLITYFFTPVVYLYVESLQERLTH